MKRLTIKDISQMLDVNPSTVSRALRDKEGISAELKKKIKDLAEELHYTPNDLAANLRSKKSKLIGIIVPQIGMFFMPDVLRGILEVLNVHGYRSLILCSEDDMEKEKENIKICANSYVEGLLIALSKDTLHTDHLRVMDDLEIPVVLFDKSIHPNSYNEVVYDNVASSAHCAKYILEKGCIEILTVYGNPGLEITRIRQQSFEEELNGRAHVHVLYASSTKEAETLVGAFLQEKKTNVDAIYCMSDEVLLGAHAAWCECEPKPQVQWISMSDGNLPTYLNKEIHFVVHDGRLMGQRAAEIVLQKLKEEVPGKVIREML